MISSSPVLLLDKRAAALAAALLFFSATYAQAGDIQMFPPIVEGTADTTCPPGARAPLTWDGQSNLTCAQGVTISGGKVGIGTADPTFGGQDSSALLGVYNNINGYVSVAIKNANSGSSAASALFLLSDVGDFSGLSKNSSTNSGYGGPGALNIGNTGNYPIALITDNSVRMTIGNNGNVGIGVTNPQAALDILAPGTGLNGPNVGALVFRVEDGMGRPSIAAFGNIDGTPFPDNVGSALEVRDQSGTGRSITTTGSIAIGGGLQPDGTYSAPSYILGDLGVGTTASPQLALDVVGGIVAERAGANQIYIQNPTGPALANVVKFNIGGPDPSGYEDFLIQLVQATPATDTPAASATSPFCTPLNGPHRGYVGIEGCPTYMLTVNGTAYATGAAGALSDRRHKTDIQPLAVDALDAVGKLKPVTFLWKAPKDDGMKGRQIGFIAQDVQPVLPDVVLTANDADKTLGIKYDSLIPVLAKAIQELEDKLRAADDLDNKLRAADDNEAAQITALTARLDALEAARR